MPKAEIVWLLRIEDLAEYPNKIAVLVYRTKEGALQGAVERVEDWEPQEWEPPMSVEKIITTLRKNNCVHLKEPGYRLEITEESVRECDDQEGHDAEA
jgi:hypothetical protein